MPTTVTWLGEGPGVAICMATSRPPVGLFYAQAPGDADFIALCDQDNVWRPDKIETLLAAFRPNQQLIFSDARVMDEGGRALYELFWSSCLRRPGDADG
jgi:GT2 family glycosyltransferase